jgi:phenylalanyl-tRNA synthetase beta chain
VKVSLAWLQELVEGALDAGELARKLTMGGLEVESRARFGDFSGVVVAEVRGKLPHPRADKLTLVDVWDGRETTRVVCGAPNVPAPGARVAWARPGARLPDGRVLEAREVRGVLSPGMLCAEDELGWSTAHEGIVVFDAADGLEPGADLLAALGLPDEIFEVNVTPNRPDCLGHVGIAREAAALLGARLRHRPRPAVEGGSALSARVEILDPEGCPRYSARLLDGISVRPSPLKVRLRLGALGVRAISNVVDATNLVMLETGQPLHAFDVDKLAGGAIVVRRARAGEPIVTLDGVTRPLTVEDVAICDAERPVAVAGVMGGGESEVGPSTTRVLLESAYFDPARVRRSAKRLGLHTEASHRFERGTDPNGVVDASHLAAARMVAWAGARAGALVDEYPRPIAPVRPTLRPARTRALLGVDVPDARQVELLERIGLSVAAPWGEELSVTVPTFRPDLTREVDLVEEVARLHGYEAIPAKVPPLHAAPGQRQTPGDALAERARDVLAGLGLDEVVTYGFVAPALIAALGHAPDDVRARPLRLANPLREEASAMRTSLVPGLLGALERNLLRGEPDVRLFEVAAVFLDGGALLPEERRHAGGLLAGRADGWLQPGPELDFFDAKGVVEGLLGALGHAAELVPPATPEAWLHPGLQARVSVEGKPIGVVGELHPDLGRKLGIEARAQLFELDLDGLGPAARPIVEELPRFPSVTRDLSFFVDAQVSARAIGEAIERVRDPLCVAVRVLEDYREPGRVPAGKKGMLWSFTYRAPDRTLIDREVQTLHERLRAALEDALHIAPR